MENVQQDQHDHPEENDSIRIRLVSADHDELWDQVMRQLLRILELHRRFCRKLVSKNKVTISDVRKAKRALDFLIKELESLQPTISILAAD